MIAVFEPLGRQAQLVGEHSMPSESDAAHLARPDRQAAGELRTDRADRNELAGGDVGRGGRDRQRRAVTGIDRAELQPVGVRMRPDGS